MRDVFTSPWQDYIIRDRCQNRRWMSFNPVCSCGFLRQHPAINSAFPVGLSHDGGRAPYLQRLTASSCFHVRNGARATTTSSMTVIWSCRSFRSASAT